MEITGYPCRLRTASRSVKRLGENSICRTVFKAILDSLELSRKRRINYSQRQSLLASSAYAFTPALRRIVIIGHQFVKADWNRFNPTNAVKRNQ